MLSQWMQNAKPQPSFPNGLIGAAKLTYPVRGERTSSQKRPKETITEIPQQAAQPGHPTEEGKDYTPTYLFWTFKSPWLIISRHARITKHPRLIKASSVQDWDRDKLGKKY